MIVLRFFLFRQSLGHNFLGKMGLPVSAVEREGNSASFFHPAIPAESHPHFY